MVAPFPMIFLEIERRGCWVVPVAEPFAPNYSQ